MKKIILSAALLATTLMGCSDYLDINHNPNYPGSVSNDLLLPSAEAYIAGRVGGNMFNYAGESWKTQRAVRHILETEYQNTPGGLAGNDDAGQMSAWYLFSAMGFYPVCPGTTRYELGSPTFSRLTLHLPEGKSFVIEARSASKDNIYVRSMKLNGQPYAKSYLEHADIVKGGLLEVEMSDQPLLAD